ncbi:hypothetical protein L3X38_041606 [Prunus dulcis]|uniref:Reverse transcriptase domain-containing protein n=1 Tax=Prunus dulcis TaxID=3755 RepID=A0AAD4UUB6_PRUDU|nr:hypothetical protein L3X38_041606 [Prunus dulcis]
MRVEELVVLANFRQLDESFVKHLRALLKEKRGRKSSKLKSSSSERGCLLSLNGCECKESVSRHFYNMLSAQPKFMGCNCSECTSINHLFFADDSLLFCDATEFEVAELQRIEIYERASGQKINLKKSTICFSSSTPPEMQAQIQRLLGVPVVPCHERYLGLPTCVEHAKKKLFRVLKDGV